MRNWTKATILAVAATTAHSCLVVKKDLKVSRRFDDDLQAFVSEQRIIKETQAKVDRVLGTFYAHLSNLGYVQEQRALHAESIETAWNNHNQGTNHVFRLPYLGQQKSLFPESPKPTWAKQPNPNIQGLSYVLVSRDAAVSQYFPPDAMREFIFGAYPRSWNHHIAKVEQGPKATSSMDEEYGGKNREIIAKTTFERKSGDRSSAG